MRMSISVPDGLARSVRESKLPISRVCQAALASAVADFPQAGAHRDVSPRAVTGESAADMPPFSGDDATCRKCANDGASTTFLQWGVCIHGSGDLIMGTKPNERLHRECGRCGFAWDEALVEQQHG